MGNGINLEAYKIRKQVQHFISLGRYEKAKAIASEIISKYPDYPYAYYDMSICEYYLGRIDNAIELCQKSLEHGMRPLAVYIMMMLYHNQKGDYDSVDLYYNNISQISTSEADVRALYGYSLWKRGRKEEGLKMIKEAFSEDSTDPVILRYLLRTSKKKKDRNQLKELIKIYMNTGASEKSKLLFAGRAEAYMGNWREAKENYRKVLGIDPTDQEAKLFFNMLEVEKGIVKMGGFVLLLAVSLYLRFSDGRILKYFSIIPILAYLTFVIVYIKKKRTLF